MAANKLNNAKSNKFSVFLNRIPNLTQLTKSVKFPDLSLENSNYPAKGMMIRTSGSALQFSNLDITFRVDEEHTIYKELLSWMSSKQINDAPGQVTTNKLEEFKEDLIVQILSSSNNPVLDYIFVGCVPTNLSMNDLNRGEAEELDATITLEFDYFKVKD